MRKRVLVPAILCLSLLATPGLAETPQPASNGSTAAADPNEKVCQNQTVVGSRLAKRRICATRAEWEERNRQDRLAVEQAQRMIGGPCTTVSNKNVGAPSC
jgi:hypothetical protein